MKLSIVYGCEMKEMDDPLVAAAEEIVTLVTETHATGALIVDAVPFRKYLVYVECLHGLTFSIVGHLSPWTLGLRYAQAFKKAIELQYQTYQKPYLWAKPAVVRAHSKPSEMVSQLLCIGKGL